MEEHKIQKSPSYKVREKVSPPPKYHVILHNDNETTMEFVVMVLMKIFRKTEHEAITIMLKVHNEGKGKAGTYSYDIAETKAQQTISEARNEGFPLQVTLEPDF